MNNPHSMRPEDALRPDPAGCTGWRLWKMTEARTGATPTDYMRAFHRYNLCTGRVFDPTMAAHNFRSISEVLVREFDRVLLLGAGVRRAAALRTPGDVYISSTIISIPHPSGRNLWYNDPVNRGAVEVLMEELYTEAVSGA